MRSAKTSLIIVRVAIAAFLSLASAMTFAALGPSNTTASVGDYAAAPPLAVQGADPFLMVDLSVELTQQAEGYTDGPQTYANGTVCGDRLTSQTTPWGSQSFGICYSANETYIGYFDATKCYAYDTSTYSNTNTDQLATGPRTDAFPHFFKPIGLATNHVCSGSFSGNYLNWSTMTALDEFRGAMTGGARLIDTSGSSATTMLIRTRRFDDWPFVIKAINASGLTTGTSTFKTNLSTVTPFTSADLAMSTTAGTQTCSCTSPTTVTCTKSGSSNKTSNSCSCSQGTTTSFSPSNTLLTVNNFSTTGSGTSYHKTRFYTYGTATTTTANTKTQTYSYTSASGYSCPTQSVSATPGSTTSTVAKLLSVGGDTDINVIVKVCDPSSSSGGLESNCVKYTDGTNTWYKPEGVMQKNSLKMTYALDSYTGRSGNTGINGGVLRANAKYIGNQMPNSTGGIVDNPNKEVDVNGMFVFDPDKLAGKTGVNGVAPVNSGVLNYINQFALFAGKYKSNDPDAELYYEGLRYIMHLGPTPSFSHPSTPLTAAEQDGYPVFSGLTNSSYTDGSGSPAWSDPVRSSCQKNYALYVGDKNTWANNYIAGGYSMDATNDPTCTTECADAVAKGINASALEDYIGSVEGTFSHTTNQGGRWAGYGTPALAWWANTHDVRTDITGNQRVKTFMVDTQEYGGAVSVGNTNELWLAAKWGGFEDSTGNNVVSATTALSATPKPDLLSEWNAQGASLNGTPLPDTYVLASQPANLVSGLTSAFNQVLQKTSAASAAAVVANSTIGTAAIYQALYQPRISNNTTAITWTGLVRSFFIDDLGRIREDTDGDGKLTNADYELRFTQDTVNQTAIVTRYTVGGSLVDTISLNQVHPIWDSSKRLAALTNAQATAQRGYSTPADQGRYIFTWIDSNNNGVIDSGEIVDFTSTNFPAISSANNDSVFDPARLLGLDSVTGSNPSKLINYIRGVDQTGYRSRTIDQGDGLGLQTQRLGDIVHSAPLVVGVPAQNYDTAYGDATYLAFKNRYANRRQVLYAGANDGMLHAFNAGFFDNATNGYFTASNAGTGPETKHPLGGELWAYIPYNLLPHLQWLADPNYQHTYYVDGAPQSYDANIFTDACADVTTCKHPYGWGTIMVVGFRFGGGDITVNATTDQSGSTDPGNRTLRSAYLVFDVTDPEQAPTLLGELSQPGMGFTMSRPVVVKHRVATAGSYVNPPAANNKWFLVMGTGPIGSDAASKQQALLNAVSNQQAGVYVYDLTAGSWVDGNAATATTIDPFPVTNATSDSFVGDMTGQDWAGDYTDEVIYFGTVGGTVASPTGDLMRMVMPANFAFGAPTFSRLLANGGGSVAQPFSMAPLATKDVTGQPWVYAGTGRFYVSNDILSSKQMSYYGVKEPAVSGVPPLTATQDKGGLINVTGIQVYTDGTIKSSAGTTVTINSQAIPDYTTLVQTVGSASGWYFDFTGTYERDVDMTEQFFDSLFITAYTVSNDTCSPLGSSRRIAAGLLTGTAVPSAPLGSSTNLINFSTSLGIGQSFSSGIVVVGSGANKIYLDTTQGSMADPHAPQRNHSISTYGRRMSWRELPVQ